MAIDIQKFIIRFVEEAREHINNLENGFQQLESEPDNQQIIQSLFRSAHTIKGSSRMLKLLSISDTAHKLEDVLGAVRDEKIAVNTELLQLLYRAVDNINKLVEMAEQAQPLPEADSDLCDTLDLAAQNRLNENKPDSSKQNPDSEVKETALDKTESDNKPDNTPEPAKAVSKELKKNETVRIHRDKLDDLIKLMSEVVSTHELMRQQVTNLKELEISLLTDEQSIAISRRLKTNRKALQEEVLRQKLLMEELHDKTLIMRMLPLSIVFDPAGRLIRELARTLDKNVECHISGQEIELDRQMIDKLSDPIIHLLRNAIDHGIETPEQRESLKKPRFGQIHLSARQEESWVTIEIRDDGSGLPLDAIKSKALHKNYYTQQELESFSDKDLIDLIFLPGFSTNAIITDMSGRGVGMDVVKKTIVEDLQGVIDVKSSDQGSCFILKLPLSLAMMRVLLFRVSSQIFGLTAQYISTLEKLKSSAIKLMAEQRVINVEHEFIPLVSMRQLLSLELQHPESDQPLIVIVKTHNQKLAIIIDELIDETDMVIKALPEHMRANTLVNGMVLTGEQELVSILNVPELMRLASTKLQKHKPEPGAAATEKLHILVVDDSLNTREIEKDVLQAHGYQVTTAIDGNDGWNKAQSGTFDAILTDVEMPGMDGFSLTQKLRKDEKFSLIPIIIVTSRESEADKKRGIEAGADAYIVKGDFEQTNLVHTLENLLI